MLAKVFCPGSPANINTESGQRSVVIDKVIITSVDDVVYEITYSNGDEDVFDHDDLIEISSSRYIGLVFSGEGSDDGKDETGGHGQD